MADVLVEREGFQASLERLLDEALDGSGRKRERDHDPMPDCLALRCPHLVIFSSADRLAPVEESVAAFTASARDSRRHLRATTTIHIVPHADHRLITPGNSAPSEHHLARLCAWVFGKVRYEGTGWRRTHTDMPQRARSAGSGAVMLKGQHQDLEILDGDEAAAAVEPERCGVAGLCLDGHAQGPGGGSRRADGVQQCPRGSAPPEPRPDVQVPELPGAAQLQGRGHDRGGGQAGQVLADAGGEDR
jgi:hypothetical protein